MTIETERLILRPFTAEDADKLGEAWQTTQGILAIGSGGLFGLGIGEGKLRDVYAASTDLVFGLICEEMGLVLGIAVLLSFAGIALFAIKSAKSSASTFYAIAAVSAAGILLRCFPLLKALGVIPTSKVNCFFNIPF